FVVKHGYNILTIVIGGWQKPLDSVDNNEPAVNAIQPNPDPIEANSGDPEQGAAVLRNSPELQALIAFGEKYLPFLLILLLKLAFDHRI
ncbi:RING finger and transmembrane domain-containing protein 2, partial [Nephila pilipes]